MQNFNNTVNTPDWFTIFRNFEQKISYNTINCCRVAIVNEFYPETLEVQVNIANKMVVGLNDDGSQILQDYAPITAKICYAGNGISYPLIKGETGIVIFSDREIESWDVNGQVNQLAYDRSHSMTDAIFIAGLFAQPNVAMAKYIEDCLHLFYGNSDIQLYDNSIIINGNITANNSITAEGLSDTTGATGTFITQDNKTISVTNGIIKSIN